MNLNDCVDGTIIYPESDSSVSDSENTIKHYNRNQYYKEKLDIEQ